MKEKIIEQAITNLKNFGYNNVTKENIFTDEIYKLFFKKMLEDNIGNNNEVDKIIHELINEIK